MLHAQKMPQIGCWLATKSNSSTSHLSSQGCSLVFSIGNELHFFVPFGGFLAVSLTYILGGFLMFAGSAVVFWWLGNVHVFHLGKTIRPNSVYKTIHHFQSSTEMASNEPHYEKKASINIWSTIAGSSKAKRSQNMPKQSKTCKHIPGKPTYDPTNSSSTSFVSTPSQALPQPCISCRLNKLGAWETLSGHDIFPRLNFAHICTW